jgi:hypothetical protein
VEARDIRAYLDRGWSAAEKLTQEHWAREYRERGRAATLEAASALREHMRLVNPGWPSESDRRDDLDHHIVLKRVIDGAARAFLQRAARDPSR